ncbi:hypothetical protein V2J09_019134 [Rumex salicifolius]
MSHTGKLMPNLDQNSTKLLNLTVLQRIDPFVEEILFTAAHVAFYEFNIDLNQWSRKDVEGSLFVVKRNTQPRFQFIVMNRRNTENLVENLLGDFEYEVQVPYLLYRNATQEVNGIWFYNTRECEEVANLFSRILNAYSKVPAKSKLSATKSEFEELEAVPTMAVMDGPLEPPPSTASNINDMPDDPAFVNFFSSAMAIGNPAIASGQPFQSGVAAPSPAPAHPAVPMPPVQSPPIMQQPLHDINTSEAINKANQTAANLIKPSIFFSPSPLGPSSSSSTTPSGPLHPPLTLQHPYSMPLQPFPPPTPPPSLTPLNAPPPQNYRPVFSRDKVREALLMVAQDNQFIDLFYQALLNSHHS